MAQGKNGRGTKITLEKSEVIPSGHNVTTVRRKGLAFVMDFDVLASLNNVMVGDDVTI